MKAAINFLGLAALGVSYASAVACIVAIHDSEALKYGLFAVLHLVVFFWLAAILGEIKKQECCEVSTRKDGE